MILSSGKADNMLKLHKILLYALKTAIHFLNQDKACNLIKMAVIARAKVHKVAKSSLATKLFIHLLGLI